MDLLAPSHWRTLDIISDVHLYEQDRPTYAAWRDYLRQCPADALFILGDLFEVWVGDDAMPGVGSLEHDCVAELRRCASQRTVFFQPGNRDFLVGDALLQWAGMQRLPDPTTLVFAGTRIVLSHGDSLCTDDLPYQRFRSEVRSHHWRREFLGKSVPERRDIARAIRQASEDGKRTRENYVDVNAEAVDALLDTEQASTLVHGHTHEGATHRTVSGKLRVVLSDWSASSAPPRLEVLRICSAAGNAGPSIRRLPLA
ncbi:UDP-2,3-diacylglucosamine diphosphatase [Curvibacter sp. APW13]|uniref:UDP-2,3-diacylglucosamine diphosphatase n=1 Tax=Curvibacter sp. APW13 TaxID=3077236 RepID=UPI0028DE5937|nr:UDP-2,3-diacylglucosamine diphosphatase [Curvibacter sp. APW13]MDT8991420.1 UDP-2,3-diacylglucosamine diphosphatase [Curvibacter sp. APW13]